MIKSYASNKDVAKSSSGTTSQTVVVTRVSELSNDKGYLTAEDLPEELDPHVSEWARQKTKPSYTAQEVGALPETTVIPDELQDLQEDATHRTVTDAEKTRWDAKQDAVVDIDAIRAGAALGATALQTHQDISGKANVGDVYRKNETYSRAEVNSLIVPADHETVIVDAANWPLATGQANTVYRVPGENSYADYGWTGSAFVKLAEYTTAYSGKVWY